MVATAYGASAKCNGEWAGRNAIGGRLKSGAVTRSRSRHVKAMVRQLEAKLNGTPTRGRG